MGLPKNREIRKAERDKTVKQLRAIFSVRDQRSGGYDFKQRCCVMLEKAIDYLETGKYACPKCKGKGYTGWFRKTICSECEKGWYTHAGIWSVDVRAGPL